MTATESNDPTLTGLWMSVSELAQARGVDKSAVSRRLQRLQDNGAQIATRREGRSLLVNVADYDVAVGENGDRARELGEQTKRGAASSDPIYTREQARRMSYEADIKKIELMRLQGELIEVKNLEAAAITAGEKMVRAFDGWISRAEDLAKEANVPVPVARAFVKLAMRDLRNALATVLNGLCALDQVQQAPLETDSDADER